MSMTKKLFIKRDSQDEQKGIFTVLEEEDIFPIIQGDPECIYYNSNDGYFLLSDEEVYKIEKNEKWINQHDLYNLLDIKELTEEKYLQYKAEAYDTDNYFTYNGIDYIVNTEKYMDHWYIDNNSLVKILNDHKINISEKMNDIKDYGTSGTGFYSYKDWTIEIIEYDCIYGNWEELTEFNEYKKIGKHADNFSSYEHYTNNDIVLTLIYSRFAGVHHTFIISNYNEVIDEIKEKVENLRNE